MACELAEPLIEGADYQLLSNLGQIKFLSSGALGPSANMEDLGDVTPGILSPGVAFWEGGAALAAGAYRIEYVNGAIEYAPCTPACWSVNTVGAGFKVQHSGGVDVDFPASTSTFETQAEAEAANAGKFIDIAHAGGTLGIFLFDTSYPDNVAGTPNPTFKLLRLGPPCAVEVDYDCPGPLLIPCSNVIKECLPCNDDPIANFTAEGPDSDRFFFVFRANVRAPLGAQPQRDDTNVAVCYSDISQQDAEDCARQNAENPLIENQGVPVFFNTFQSCTAMCPDGSPFTYVVPSGTVLGFTQAQANHAAHGLACQRANQNGICITTKALNAACLGAPYSATLRATGGIPFVVTFQNIVLLPIECDIHIGDTFPYLWAITLGELPDGLTLNQCTGVISGTPTEAVDVSITIRATDANGSFFQKDLILVVGEITNDNPLPNALQFAPYSEQLNIDGSSDHEGDAFTISAGALPDGLTLSTAGLISGNAIGPVGMTYSFTVRCIFPAGDGMGECIKQFMLTVVPSLLSYWTMDEAASPRVDSVGDNDLAGPATGVVVGVISDAVINATGSIIQKLGAGGLWVYERGMTMTGWFKFTALGGGGNVGTTGFAMTGPGLEFFGLLANNSGQLLAVSRASAGFNSEVALSGVVLNTFIFIRMWVDPADNKVHCKINEGATHDGVLPMTPTIIPIPALNIFVIGTPLGDATVDELAIFGRILTDADGAALYNGGTGARPPLP